MMENSSFTLVREFAATPQVMWDAWTAPELMAQWMHPRGVTTPAESVSSHAVVGGGYSYTMVHEQSGTEYATAGTYLEIDPPSRLVCTWGPVDDPTSAVRLTVVFEPSPAGTKMTFTCGIPAEPGDDVHDGWAEALDHLAEATARLGR